MEAGFLEALPSDSSPPELSSPTKAILTGSIKESRYHDMDTTHAGFTAVGFPDLTPVTEGASFLGTLPTIPEYPGLDSSPTEPTALASSPPRIPSPPSSITTTPSIPAAKRRRLNSSVNKLIKPFKSPLKVDNSLHNVTTGVASPLRYPPSTPPQKVALPYTPLRPVLSPTKEADEGDDISPTKAPLPQRSAKSTVKSSNPPFRSSFKKAPKLNLSSPAATSTKDPYILSLEQKHAKLQTALRDAKQLLEESSQALKIEQSGEDEKLEELITKWRAAAQAAADHMFSSVEQRVARMGGVSAYREMQNRRSGGGWGFSEDPEDGLTEDQKEARRQAMYEAGFDEVSQLEKQQNETNTAKDNNNDQFTMDMMLGSLNIDLDIMGYDKNLQRWVN
ncbi:hypothetical protein ABW21_db0206802 [Orbilia brochopaga]|nr:hypothetical protein ABW21_db0206802 [Drechslerella brochopaga]